MTASLTSGRREAFDAHVADWLKLSESVPGRLRHLEVLHHLRSHLPGPPLLVLDAGGGTGEIAAAVARDGHKVTLLDYSPAMLDEAKRRCRGLDVACVSADISQVGVLFEPGSFDVVLCHSVLEFVDDLRGSIEQLAEAVRAGGLLSILVGNRHHAPLRKALLTRDFSAARRGLEAEVPAEDVFGLPRKTYYPEAIREMIEACGLRVAGEYGIRVFADLLGQAPEDLDGLLALELAAGARLPYSYMARFVMFVAAKG